MKLQQNIQEYLDYCRTQKMLDWKTIKAYRIDLFQFSSHIGMDDIYAIHPLVLENYISYLHQTFKPKTVKRKIASTKTFFRYLEFRNIITINPFNKIQVKYREPITLPKTIPLHNIETFLKTIYSEYRSVTTKHQKERALRDIAVCELLFGTGMRISELCSLLDRDIDLFEGIILIRGKGSKERRLQIGNQDVLHILNKYRSTYLSYIDICGNLVTLKKRNRRKAKKEKAPTGAKLAEPFLCGLYPVSGAGPYPPDPPAQRKFYYTISGQSRKT